jgi:Zn-dependent protease
LPSPGWDNPGISSQPGIGPRPLWRGQVIVFLLEPARTAYDLNWRMFGIPVRVHPMFWLLTVALGWPAMNEGFSYLLVWVFCVFVSILIHEMGHILAYRLYGVEGHIVLYSFGGLAVGYQAVRSRWERIAVSFAGPLAGFIFLGLIVWLVSVLNPDVFAYLVSNIKYWLGLRLELDDARRLIGMPTLAETAILDLFQINMFWGLLNLLPIWPLDGGQISRELFDAFLPDNGMRVSLAVSGAIAGLLALNSLMATYGRPLLPFLNLRGLYTVIFFGLLAVSSFQAMQQLPSRRPWREEHPTSWDQDREYWDKDRNRWER